RTARHLARSCDQIVTMQDFEPPTDVFSAGAIQQRWVGLYERELNDLLTIAERLERNPSSVAATEIQQALVIGRELERTLFAIELRAYSGSWVAVRANKVIASSPDQTDLLDQLRRSGARADLLFKVTDPELQVEL
ncbi:MAG: hypothetical protein JWN04_1964, partial [Myxococcaceae bacterium]|nr:hypothetical protein [Myxococcaceae bacterium]